MPKVFAYFAGDVGIIAGPVADVASGGSNMA
jgi:hypothetical protein